MPHDSFVVVDQLGVPRSLVGACGAGVACGDITTEWPDYPACENLRGAPPILDGTWASHTEPRDEVAVAVSVAVIHARQGGGTHQLGAGPGRTAAPPSTPTASAVCFRFPVARARVRRPVRPRVGRPYADPAMPALRAPAAASHVRSRRQRRHRAATGPPSPVGGSRRIDGRLRRIDPVTAAPAKERESAPLAVHAPVDPWCKRRGARSGAAAPSRLRPEWSIRVCGGGTTQWSGSEVGPSDDPSGRDGPRAPPAVPGRWRGGRVGRSVG